MPPTIKAEGRYGEALHRKMQEHEMDIRRLALESGATYEHIRKLVRGMALPSGSLMTGICKVLKWDKGEAQRLVAADQVEKKYGTDLPKEMTGIDPALVPFNRVIPKLDPEQRKMLLTMAKSLITE